MTPTNGKPAEGDDQRRAGVRGGSQDVVGGGGAVKVNQELSRQLREKIPPLGWVRCYRVAWAVLSLPEMDKAFYIEGGVKFIQIGRHFMHGWLELDGEIIDPTWYMHDLEYRPRYRIPKDAALEIWHKLGETLPLDPRPQLV